MRWVILAVLVAIVLMFFGGWLYYRDTGETSEIIIDRKEVQQDTEEVIEEGTDMVESAVDEVQDLGGEESSKKQPSEQGAASPQ